MGNIYVTKTIIKNESIEELDFVLYDEFGFDYENTDQFIEIQSKHGYANADPIKIDELISILQELKNNGATHIEIEANCDHHGYDMTSYKIELSSDDDIKEYEEKRNLEIQKRNKIKELQEQIKTLSK
jgi:hypothetical protein